MVSAIVTFDDLSLVRDLILEMHRAGRASEVNALIKVHAVLQDILCQDLDLDEDDPEFVREMEEAERDLAEGRWRPHEEVMHRLGLSEDA